jgi:hypothetical protein
MLGALHVISPSDMVRALTVKQPWAWAIREGWKDVENRNWPMPKFMLGEWCALHASKSWDVEGFDGFAEIMQRTGRGDSIDDCDDVRGALIAVVRMEGDVLRHSSPWFVGPHGFVMRDVIALPNPIECRGALNFWRLPSTVDAALREQLAAA